MTTSRNPFPSKPKSGGKPFAPKAGRDKTPLQNMATTVHQGTKPGGGPKTKHQHHYGKKR